MSSEEKLSVSKAIPDAGDNPIAKDDVVDLLVGGYSYTTTRAVLLSSPFHKNDSDQTYFHALLSGRWKRAKLEHPIEIPDQDGRLFFYVLYYLQLGQLPRDVGSRAYRSLLSKEDIDKLESQADFFGLTGLVDLCKATKDVLKGVEGTGDLDLTPFSDFSVEIEHNCTRNEYEFSFNMKYTYNGVTKFGVSLQTEERNDKFIHINAYTYEKCYVTTKSFPDSFDRLRKIIEDEHAKKSSEKEPVSVTCVLDQSDVAPEARLWYAFVVNDMIHYYDTYKDFDGGEYGDAVGFLVSDTTSCFVCGMKSVE